MANGSDFDLHSLVLLSYFWCPFYVSFETGLVCVWFVLFHLIWVSHVIFFIVLSGGVVCSSGEQGQVVLVMKQDGEVRGCLLVVVLCKKV